MANSFCAPWAYFQSFSLYAAKCRSTKCWNKLCLKAAWHLQALCVIYGTKRLADKLVGKQCRPLRFWVRPGRTSAWWGNFVNPQWIRCESDFDLIYSEYVWTGESDMNTLWSHNVWTRIFSYPEKKSCGFNLNPQLFPRDVLVLFTTWNGCSCVGDVSMWWQMFSFVFLSLRRWFQFNSRIHYILQA
mgnify:CR=1 FL=1